MHTLMKGLLDKTVLVVGCGGLGCNVVEYLARSYVNKLIIMDKDVFEPNNLNRQLYCNVKTLGRYKVEVASERIAEISETLPIIIDDKFPSSRLDRYKDDIDIIVDCVDNADTRLEIEEFAASINVPLVHGAINGTIGQITTIMPGDFTLKKIYTEEILPTEETIAYVPSLIASLQAAEVVNVLNGKPTLRGELLLVDLVTMSFKKIKI